MESEVMEGEKTKNTENTKKERNGKKDSNFECNICFDDVNEPVVTRCGHLFCWSCILSWMNRRNDQCPICQAGISRDNVIPLYGHGKNNKDPRNETTEPRPKAERPASSSRSRSPFAGFEAGISISFGMFPFSFSLPVGLWSSGNGSSILNFFGFNRSTTEMNEEERRAYTNSLFLTIIGILMLAYILFCA